MPYSMVIHGDPWKETQPYITFITPTLVIHGDPLLKKKKYQLVLGVEKRPETTPWNARFQRFQEAAERCRNAWQTFWDGQAGNHGEPWWLIPLWLKKETGSFYGISRAMSNQNWIEIKYNELNTKKLK